MINPWKILGVHRESTEPEIKARYKALMMEHHPDKGGSADEAAKITEAYKTLMDKELVRQATATLEVLGAPCPTCKGKGYTFKQRGLTERKTNPCGLCGGRGILVEREL